MTVLITDRTTGESYTAKCVEDCGDDRTDRVGFTFAVTYGKMIVFGETVYEPVNEKADETIALKIRINELELQIEELRKILLERETKKAS